MDTYPDTSPTTSLKKLIVPTIIIVFLIGFAVAGLAIWQHSGFRVSSTNPATKSMSTISPFFKINFSEAINKDSLRITSSPSGFTGTPSVSGKVVTIPLNIPLNSSKTYSITLVNATSSTSGKQITNKTYTFKPTFITSSDLPEDQQQALIQQENIGGVASTTDPILNDLPYATTDFALTQDSTPYEKVPPHFALYANLTLSISDMSHEDSAIAQYKQEVNDYITSLGLSPSNYSITYGIETP